MRFEVSQNLTSNHAPFDRIRASNSFRDSLKVLFAPLNRDVYILDAADFTTYNNIQAFDNNHEFVLVIPRTVIRQGDIVSDGRESNVYQYLSLHPNDVHDANNFWSSRYHNRQLKLWTVADIVHGRTIPDAHIIKDLRGIEIAFYDSVTKAVWMLGNVTNFIVPDQFKGLFFYIAQQYQVILDGLALAETVKVERMSLAQMAKISGTVQAYDHFVNNANNYISDELGKKVRTLSDDIQALNNSIIAKSREADNINLWYQTMKDRVNKPEVIKGMMADKTSFANLLKSGRYKDIYFDGATVDAYTNMILIGKKYPIGEFQIKFGLDGSLWIDNLTPGRTIQEHYQHPHVLKYLPCLGNFKDKLPNMLKDFQIAGALDMMHTFLSHYHRENPYRKLKEWFQSEYPQDVCVKCNEMKTWCRCVHQCATCGQNPLSCECHVCPGGLGPITHIPGNARVCNSCQHRAVHPSGDRYTCTFVVGTSEPLTAPQTPVPSATTIQAARADLGMWLDEAAAVAVAVDLAVDPLADINIAISRFARNEEREYVMTLER